MTRLESARYLAGSRDETCKFQIPDVCTNKNVVPCHARDRHTGGAQKASDLSVIDGCQQCHDVFDRRAKMPNGEYISDDDWHVYALRGLQDTLEARRAKGLLVVPEDTPKPFSARPTKPRVPKAQRKQIRGRGFEQGQRKIQGRNTLRKART